MLKVIKKIYISLFIFIFFLLPINSNAQSNQSKLKEIDSLIVKGDYENALKMLQKQKEPAAKLLIGEIFLETGRYAEIRENIKKLLNDKKLSIQAKTLYAEALSNEGNYSEAIKVLEKIYNNIDARRARILLAFLYKTTGRNQDAENLFYTFVDEYNNDTISPNDAEGLSYVARSVAELEAWQDANNAFTESTKADPQRIETQLKWALLFLKKYDPGHAEECINSALKVNPNHAEAHLIMAKIKLAQSFNIVEAEKELSTALKTNPYLTEAYALKANIAIMERRWEDAKTLLDKALSINKSNLYALSIKEGLYIISDNEAEAKRAKTEISNFNPTYLDDVLYITELLEWEHRYDDIISINNQALKINPDFWPAKTNIGINLLRNGDENLGLPYLRESWEYDPYNVRVYNILNLYDDVITKQYEFITDGILKLRVDKSMPALVNRYLNPLFTKAVKLYKNYYKISPPDPLIIELYSDEDYFSRRTAGLPNIGVQGVCFGRVITAMGPGIPQLNWGEIVWHELSHIFTLTLSKNRVPRWHTEGVAVYDTYSNIPYWNYRISAKFYRYLKEGRLPSLAQFDLAFTRVTNADQMMLGYYTSSKLVEFMAKLAGRDILQKQLVLFSKGKRTSEVIKLSLKMEPEKLEELFIKEMLSKLDPVYSKNYVIDYQWYIDEKEKWLELSQKNPQNYDYQAKVAISTFVDDDIDNAKNICDKVLSSEPSNWRCLHLLADISLKQKKVADYISKANNAINAGFDGYELRIVLSELGKTMDEKIKHLQAASKLDPETSEPHIILAKLYEKNNDTANAINEYKAGIDVDEHNTLAFNGLISLLYKQNNWDELVNYGEKAIWADTINPKIHLIVGQAYLKTGKLKQSLFELESALLCPEIKQEDRIEILSATAQTYIKLGKKRNARDYIEKALKLDPKNQDLLKLKRGL